jgi:hypothetical protein
VTCRDARAWRALLEHRLADVPEPAEWPDAAAHLSSCGACRRIALAIDPTLLFPLAFQGLAQPSSDATADVEAMRQAVSSLRRARDLGVSAPEGRDRRAVASRRAKLMRVAAAAVLVFALGSQLPIGRRSVDAALPAPLPAVAEVLPVDLQGGGGDSLGVSGDVGRPSARIYQIAYRDMAVVMVVDKSLDL